jgi:hypothetical protein
MIIIAAMIIAAPLWLIAIMLGELVKQKYK